MTKAECIEVGYFSEEYFTADSDGWYYDLETGERVAQWKNEPPKNDTRNHDFPIT